MWQSVAKWSGHDAKVCGVVCKEKLLPCCDGGKKVSYCNILCV